MLGRYIDYGNPISADPLNDRLEAAWLVLPDANGLSEDLTNTYPYPELRKRFPGSPGGAGSPLGWRHDPNGFPALYCNGGGAGTVVNVLARNTETALNYTASFSVGCWFRQDAIGSGTSNLSGLVSKYHTVEAWNLRISSQTLQFVSSAVVAGGTTTLGKWHCVIGTADSAGQATIYLDGVSVATGDPIFDPNTVDAVRLCVDFITDTTYRGLNGLFGGGWFWSRTLSRADARAWTEQCRQGFPDVLSRWSFTPRLFVPVVVAGATVKRIVGRHPVGAGITGGGIVK